MLARVNWYLQSSLKHITEQITGNKFYYRGGRYRQVSLYPDCVCIMESDTYPSPGVTRLVSEVAGYLAHVVTMWPL